MTSPISNGYHPGMKRIRLDPAVTYLYHPESIDQWTYSHHGHIAHFRNRYYAIWSSGTIDEDNVGQRIMLSTSEDFTRWTEPVQLADTQMGEYNELVLTAGGFHRTDDKLIAYYSQYEYEPWNIERGTAKKLGRGVRNRTLNLRCTADGVNWETPLNVDLPTTANFGPQKTASGRLIISGAVEYPYTDDPEGIRGWRMSGIYPEDMDPRQYEIGFGGSEQPEFAAEVYRRLGLPAGVRLNEGSFYQTDDGVIHMLLRSRTPYLWVTESTDDGETWSPPVRTDFSDNQAKFHFGRLPDGRFYYVGNPDQRTVGTGNPLRCPLVLSLSEDGTVFDRHYILADTIVHRRFQGREKVGIYAYPNTIVHDEALCVAFSINKEDIAVLRVPLSDLR